MRLARSVSVVVSAGLVVALGLSLNTREALAKKKAPRVVGTLEPVQTPLGLQGAKGLGANCVIPFALVHQRRKKHFIQVQWGHDSDGNGLIEDNEFSAATHDIEDQRDTGKLRKLRKTLVAKYRSGRGIGAANALVWNTAVDLPEQRIVTQVLERDANGRTVRDPLTRDSVLIREGLGVRVRVRAVLGSKKPIVGDWVETESFSVDNARPPAVRAGRVFPGDVALVQWTAISPDSEDANGDGVLDPGEDLDGDLQADFRPLAVAVDYARAPTDRVDVSEWLPCTEAAAGGDPSVDQASSPEGVMYLFAWDTSADLTDRSGEFLLRVRTFDPLTWLVSEWVQAAGAFRLED